MDKKYSINETKNIIKNYTVFKKDKNNEEALFFKYTNNLIHVFNSHFSSYITIEDFLEQFKDSTFYIYEQNLDDNDVEENKSYYRQ